MVSYHKGEPIGEEGALPLGMIDGADFSVMHFQLEDYDKLVLMSDGIVEATNHKGHLFGFERIHELLRTGHVRRRASQQSPTIWPGRRHQHYLCHADGQV